MVSLNRQAPWTGCGYPAAVVSQLGGKWGAAALAVGLVGGMSAFWLASWGPTDRQVLAAAAGVVLSFAFFTVIQVRRSRGWLDLFHPLLFPSLYAGITFLLPAWVLFVKHEPVGFLLGTPISHRAGWLMAAAAVSFTAACASTGFLAVRDLPARYHPVPRRLRIVGWVLLTVPLGAALRDVSANVVLTRGIGQTDYGLDDSLNALAFIAAPAAALILMAAQRLGGKQTLLPLADLAALGVLVGALGVNGRRGAALAVLLVLVYGWAVRRRRGVSIVAGAVAVAVFAYAVVAYRAAATGEQARGVFFTLVRDINPALFTTGTTAAVIPENEPYLGGSTYLAGLLRQVPGPLASAVLGPPDDTGTAQLRRVLGYYNPNQGLAFSVPAEGYMNFGILGLVAACAVLGAVLAWAYRRQGDWSRPIHLLYPLMLGTLPFGLRSDFLGLTKGILYPLIMVAAAYWLARRPDVLVGTESTHLHRGVAAPSAHNRTVRELDAERTSA